MLTLTKNAAKEVNHIIDGMEDKGDKKFFLRVGAKGGGCSGFSFSLDITEEKADADQEWGQHGINVICDPISLIYLDGTTVDFKDELNGRGFTFDCPSAVSKCGCGSSFSV